MGEKEEVNKSMREEIRERMKDGVKVSVNEGIREGFCASTNHTLQFS